jgi:hypothetical protein
MFRALFASRYRIWAPRFGADPWRARHLGHHRDQLQQWMIRMHFFQRSGKFPDSSLERAARSHLCDVRSLRCRNKMRWPDASERATSADVVSRLRSKLGTETHLDDGPNQALLQLLWSCRISVGIPAPLPDPAILIQVLRNPLNYNIFPELVQQRIIVTSSDDADIQIGWLAEHRPAVTRACLTDADAAVVTNARRHETDTTHNANPMRVIAPRRIAALLRTEPATSALLGAEIRSVR